VDGNLCYLKSCSVCINTYHLFSPYIYVCVYCCEPNEEHTELLSCSGHFFYREPEHIASLHLLYQ